MIVQHTLELPAELEELLALAEQHNLAVIEDCAHALGSWYHGKHMGMFGDAAFFSSQWSKPTPPGWMASPSPAIWIWRCVSQRCNRRSPCRPRTLNGVFPSSTSFYQRFFSPQLYWFAATRWTDGIGGRFIRRDRAWGQHVGRPPEGAPVLQNAAFLAMEKLAGRWTDYLVVINHEDEAAARAPST